MRISIRFKWTALISIVILLAYIFVSVLAMRTVQSVASVNEINNFTLKLVIGGVVVFLLGIVLSFYAVTLVLNDLKKINKTIDDLNKKPDSDSRIKLRKRNDEIYDLTININKMLDRMQAYNNQQNEFV